MQTLYLIDNVDEVQRLDLQSMKLTNASSMDSSFKNAPKTH